jgi:ubiquinone biosynthesis protein COQ9
LTDEAEKEALLKAVLKHAPFDGWSGAAFSAGIKDAQLNADRAAILFPRGIADIAIYFGNRLRPSSRRTLSGWRTVNLPCVVG